MITRAQIKRKMQIVFAQVYRRGLKNYNFSIISNNCWGGAVYDMFHLPYKTPTIGLWMTADDYLCFLKNISFYFSQDLKQIEWSESHCAQLLQERKKSGKYKFELCDLIIGRLFDIDIVFLHYHSFEEAKEKWDRRKNRINYDNLIVKFNDQNGFQPHHFDVFENLPFKNKLFITAHNDLCGKPNVVFINEPDLDGSVKDDTIISKMPFNLKQYLNKIGDDRDEFKNIEGGGTLPPR